MEEESTGTVEFEVEDNALSLEDILDQEKQRGRDQRRKARNKAKARRKRIRAQGGQIGFK